MSTNAAVPFVVGGAVEFAVVCVGPDVSSTADVGGGFVVTVVRGGGTADDEAGVTVDVDVDWIVSTVSTASTEVPDDADVGAVESSPSLHPPTATVSSATSTTLDREIIRSIMSSWVTKVPAMRDNGARLPIANFTLHTQLRFKFNGTGPQ